MVAILETLLTGGENTGKLDVCVTLEDHEVESSYRVPHPGP